MTPANPDGSPSPCSSSRSWTDSVSSITWAGRTPADPWHTPSNPGRRSRCRLEAGSISPLIDALGKDFYADTSPAQRAVITGSSFNVVHLASGVKVDLLVRGTDPFDLSEFDRASVIPIQGTGEAPALVRVKTVEDTILRKLQWYRLGGKQSDRQWTDILGCLRGQTATIDHDYLGRWARDLGVDDLLDRAYAEA